MAEIDISALLVDLVEKAGEIQGTQNILVLVSGGVGATIATVIGYLGHCVFLLGREITDLKSRLPKLGA